MDIFIAYSSSDRAFANRLVAMFRDLGWSVFIDTGLNAGAAFNREIEEQLTAARVAVVLWSSKAKVSDFVLDEATRAKDANKLVPVLIEDIIPPLGFGQRHTLDLSNWKGEDDHEDCKALISSLKRSLEGRTAKSTAAPAPTPTARTGDITRHPLQDSSQGPEMVAIPAGNFLMGSTNGEGSKREKPQHPVTIAQPFLMGRYAVTVDEYRQFCDATGADADNAGKSAEHPAVNVSWNDATAYCKWLSEETGKHYTLPSEAQWEYACRAGSTTACAFGDNLQESEANFSQKSGGTVAVNRYQPNTFGLFQMHGNVWEWCEDTWHSNYKKVPTDGSAWIDSGSEARVLRGGSWFNGQSGCRSSIRSYGARPDFRYSIIGFRLTCLFPR